MHWSAEDIWKLAQAAHRSGLAPDAARNVDACYYIMCAGADLGIQPTIALRILSVVKGRITIGAEAMLALAIRAGVRMEWVQTDATVASLRLMREGHAPYLGTFSIEEAKRAGLGGGNWERYAPAMLRARCISSSVRAYCPDVITGLYTPEEVAAFSGGEDITNVRSIPSPAPAPAPAGHDRAKWLSRVGILPLVESYCGASSGWGEAELEVVQGIVFRVAEKLDEPARTADCRPTALWVSDKSVQRAVYRITEAVIAKMQRERDATEPVEELERMREPGEEP